MKTNTIGPARATAGPGKPFSRGPITTSFRMCDDNDHDDDYGGGGSGNYGEGEGCHLTI